MGKVFIKVKEQFFKPPVFAIGTPKISSIPFDEVV